MGRPKSPYGRSRSRTNAIKHGVLSRHILLSRGPSACPLAGTCHVVRDPELAAACIPGSECLVERTFRDMYVDDARRSFAFCMAWLSDHEFEQTIAELAIVALQRQRLSAMIAREGFTRPKTHPVSGITYGIELSLSAGRYATAIDNRWNGLMSRITTDSSGVTRGDEAA